MTTKEAIWMLERLRADLFKENDDGYKALDLALAAWREKAEREEEGSAKA